MRNLRIVYMGTPEFAVPGLKLLVENGYNIVAVITAPDKPQGRGLKLGETPVKEYAKSVGLPILQPEKLKNEDFLAELKALRADLQIVVAFRMLPELVWNMPPMGTFNLHASLLPQYRGAAPINWAIINGETETGVTTFFLKHEIDTGDLILQEKEPILENDTVDSLYERLMNRGAALILKTVQLIENDGVVPIAQVQTAELKHAPKIFKENCKIDWHWSAAQIKNFVRGLSPYPTAFCHINGMYCKIYKAEYHRDATTHPILQPFNFEVRNKKTLVVGTGDGEIIIEDLQLEGKKRMDIGAFLMGNEVKSIS
ncbi:MAG: methionyl-tRNA formyltransferase [Cytophagales bacterium]